MLKVRYRNEVVEPQAFIRSFPLGECLMLASFLFTLLFISVLHSGSAFLLRFPSRFKASRTCMVQPEAAVTEGAKVKEVSKIGNRRFVRKVKAPIPASPADILITKVDQQVESNADEGQQSDDNIFEDFDRTDNEEEEDEENQEPLSVEIFKPPERYSKMFVCVADVLNNEMRSKRSELFAPHMQWARRSVLSQHLEPFEHQNNQTGEYYTTDKVLVKDDFTLLTEDCTAPASQLLFVRSDSAANVHDFHSLEPLVAHQAISPWKVFEFVLEQNSSSRFLDNEEEEQHKLEEIFDNDLLSGYMLLSLCNNITKPNNNEAAGSMDNSDTIVDRTNDMRELVDNSFRYHAKAARMEFVKPEDRPQETDSYLPLYDETARIVTLGRLYHTDASIATTPTTSGSQQTTTTNTNLASPITDATNTDTTSTSTYPYMNPYLTHEDEDYPEPGVLAGQLVFFNALSRADAIRYLKRDPVAFSGLLNNHITNKDTKGASTGMFDRMTLSVANVQDVSGMNHYMPRDYVGKFQMDTVHFMDPEDLLLQNETFVPSFTDFLHTDSTKDMQFLPPLPKLPEHYTMNANLLKQLDAYNVTFRYDRLQFDPIVTDIYSDEFSYDATDIDIDDHSSDGHLYSARGRRKRSSFTHPLDDEGNEEEEDDDDVIDVESSEEAINWDEELLQSDEY